MVDDLIIDSEVVAPEVGVELDNGGVVVEEVEDVVADVELNIGEDVFKTNAKLEIDINDGEELAYKFADDPLEESKDTIEVDIDDSKKFKVPLLSYKKDEEDPQSKDNANEILNNDVKIGNFCHLI